MMIIVAQCRHKPKIDEEDIGEEWLLFHHGSLSQHQYGMAKTVAF